jgi:hypothetical protein
MFSSKVRGVLDMTASVYSGSRHVRLMVEFVVVVASVLLERRLNIVNQGIQSEKN